MNKKNTIHIKIPACAEMYTEAKGIKDRSFLSVLYGEFSRA